ncbi:hypothetical protein HK096_000157, partial [Nowakowskiella sp. JEL0078]
MKYQSLKKIFCKIFANANATGNKSLEIAKPKNWEELNAHFGDKDGVAHASLGSDDVIIET